MSFGWSVGDIVAALKLLHQITTALKDSGGASSEFQDVLSFLQTFSQTLQHLNALQSTPLDPDLAENLQNNVNTFVRLYRPFWTMSREDLSLD